MCLCDASPWGIHRQGEMSVSKRAGGGATRDELAARSSAAVVGDYHRLTGTARTDALQRMLIDRLVAHTSEIEIPKRGSDRLCSLYESQHRDLLVFAAECRI